MRMPLLAGAALLALALGGPALAQSRAKPKPIERTAAAEKEGAGKERPSVDRGIVQAVSGSAIVLKELDGSTLAIRADARTRVFVDGKRASLLEIQPGFVAVVTHERNRAREIRAFDAGNTDDKSASAPRKERGGRK